MDKITARELIEFSRSILPEPDVDDEIKALIETCICQGHFELSSGKHSSVYVQTAPLFELHQMRGDLAQYLLLKVSMSVPLWKIDTVVAMANGAVLLGCEMARQVDKRFLFMEKGKLERGQFLRLGERVLIAENVSTTGGTVNRAIEELIRLGANVLCVASLVIRSPLPKGNMIPRVSVYETDFPLHDKMFCPLCESGEPLRERISEWAY